MKEFENGLKKCRVLGHLKINFVLCPCLLSALQTFKMATSSIQAPNLFNVNGLVAVITGGGSGRLQQKWDVKTYYILMLYRDWSDDGQSLGSQWGS